MKRKVRVNPIARAPILRKGCAHVKSVSAKRAKSRSLIKRGIYD